MVQESCLSGCRLTRAPAHRSPAARASATGMFFWFWVRGTAVRVEGATRSWRVLAYMAMVWKWVFRYLSHLLSPLATLQRTY